MAAEAGVGVILVVMALSTFASLGILIQGAVASPR